MWRFLWILLGASIVYKNDASAAVHILAAIPEEEDEDRSAVSPITKNFSSPPPSVEDKITLLFYTMDVFQFIEKSSDDQNNFLKNLAFQDDTYSPEFYTHSLFLRFLMELEDAAQSAEKPNAFIFSTFINLSDFFKMLPEPDSSRKEFFLEDAEAYEKLACDYAQDKDKDE